MHDWREIQILFDIYTGIHSSDSVGHVVKFKKFPWTLSLYTKNATLSTKGSRLAFETALPDLLSKSIYPRVCIEYFENLLSSVARRRFPHFFPEIMSCVRQETMSSVLYGLLDSILLFDLETMQIGNKPQLMFTQNTTCQINGRTKS